MRVKQFIGSEYVTHIEQIHPPQPAESPDDWVTQDVVVRRTGVDESRWISELNGTTTPWELVTRTYISDQRHGSIITPWRLEVRCRRRDYPQQPIEVHTGGPYVARSEYERVCGERDILKDDQKSLLADLKDAEQTVIHLNKRVFVNNPNGWPIVPVDPSCIPDGYRAVEVTRKTKGKLVAVQAKAVPFHTEADYANLVVEPIPTPTQDALPRPEFPAWIRAGWWVAMDAGGFWYISRDEPVASERDPGQSVDSGTWNPPEYDDIQLKHGVTASMKAVPSNRWREAKWQIE